MRAWKCKQVIDFDQSTTTVKEERNKTLCWMNQMSYYNPSCYIGTQLDLSQVTILKKKIWNSASEVKRIKEE